jgi:hypothetical protein
MAWLLTLMVMVLLRHRAIVLWHLDDANKRPAAGISAPGRADVWTQAVQWLCDFEGELLAHLSRYVSIGSNLQKFSRIFEIEKIVDQDVELRCVGPCLIITSSSHS